MLVSSGSLHYTMLHFYQLIMHLLRIVTKRSIVAIQSLMIPDIICVWVVIFQIYVYELKDNELCGASFIDSQIYIHQMVSIKNLVLVADIQMSVSVLRYQVDHRVLSIVSRVCSNVELYACLGMQLSQVPIFEVLFICRWCWKRFSWNVCSKVSVDRFGIDTTFARWIDIIPASLKSARNSC